MLKMLTMTRGTRTKRAVRTVSRSLLSSLLSRAAGARHTEIPFLALNSD